MDKDAPYVYMRIRSVGQELCRFSGCQGKVAGRKVPDRCTNLLLPFGSFCPSIVRRARPAKSEGESRVTNKTLSTEGIRRGWEIAAPAYREGFALALQEISHELARRLPSRLPTPVLDLACGPGTAMATLEQYHGPILSVGCDFSHAMVGFARKTTGGGHGVVADQDLLPFAPATFGTVVSSMGTIFSREPERQLGTIATILKTGGCYGFSAWGEPHENAMGAVSRRVVDSWPYSLSSAPPPIETPYSQGQSPWLSRATEKAGLSIVSVTSHWLVFRFPDRGAAARALAGTGRLALLTGGAPAREQELLDRLMEAFLPHEDRASGQVELANRYHLFVLSRSSGQ